MLNRRIFLKYWLPPLLWMAVIFSASGDQASFQRSSRFIEPLLHLLFPAMSQETVNGVVVVVRKCAHLTEYAILSLLLWRALRKPVKNDPRPWSWPLAAYALLIVVLYALSDEFHQFYVPSREASLVDVLIDSLGGALGLLFIWGLLAWKRRRHE